MTLTSSLCLALVIYKEARSSSIHNQELVARSVITRAHDRGHHKYCKVIFEKHQYSWTDKTKFKAHFKSLESMMTYYKINDKLAFGKAMWATNKALIFNHKEIRHFYTPRNHFKPDWSKGMTVAYKDKDFVFLKD